MRKSMVIAAMSMMLSVMGTGICYGSGWQQDENGWWYEYDGGSYAKAGLRQIGDQYYAFDGNGYMLTGWQYIGFRWHYLDPDSGVMATGWRQVDGNWYYLDPDDNGSMRTYWLDLGKKRYYLDENGAMKVGLFYLGDYTSGSQYAYQTDSSGALIRNKTMQLGDKTVRFGDDGVMMYKDERTKLKAKVDGSDPWQYVLSEKELAESDSDSSIEEAVEDVKSDLSDEYREKIKGLSSGTRKDEKIASWEKKVRKKLQEYLVEGWETEEFIYDVEHGTYY